MNMNRPSPTCLVVLSVILCTSQAFADDIVSATGVAGTSGNDLLTVDDPTDVDANARDSSDSDEDIDQSDVADGDADIDLSQTANADADGIDGLAGDDTIGNTAAVNATASSNAGAGAGRIDAAFDQSTSMDVSSNARASSDGIEGGADSNSIDNSGELTVSATATSGSQAATSTVANPAEPLAEVQANLNSNATAVAAARGINAGEAQTSSATQNTTRVGSDSLQIVSSDSTTTLSSDQTVINNGAITGTATATGNGSIASAALGASGSTNATANVGSDAASRGIVSGGGSDSIDNAGLITSDATATALAIDLSLSAGQGQAALPDSDPVSSGDMSAQASATSVGIDSDGLNHNSERNRTVSIAADGISTTSSHSTSSNAGNDDITNTVAIDATSVASSLGLAGAGAIASDGPSSLNAASAASGYSAAIVSGGEDDTVTNTGTLQSDATSSAIALAINFSGAGTDAAASANANVSSRAEATGISADGNNADTLQSSTATVDQNGLALQQTDETVAHTGDDVVTSDADIGAIASATSGAGGASISIGGSTSSELASTAESRAAAIDLGGGGDVLTGTGSITANSTSTATAVGVVFSQDVGQESSTSAKVDTSAVAASTATGVAGDSGIDTSVSTTLTAGLDGLAFVRDAQTIATSGDDDIDFTGPVTVEARSLSTSVSGGISINDAADSGIESRATSVADGILGGGGNDVVASDGDLASTSSATAFGVSAAAGVTGASSGIGRTSASAGLYANAESNGVAGDGGVDSTRATVSVDIDEENLRASYLTVSTASSGDDVIETGGSIASDATATTGGATVTVLTGQASSRLDSDATAIARGVDAGPGSDSLDNRATVTTSASTTAVTINAAVSGQSGATADSGLLGAGTTAAADAVGLSTAGHGHENSTLFELDTDYDSGVFARYETVADNVSGDGDDTIDNTGSVTTDSTATTAQATVGVSGSGLALTIGRTESEAHAGGIETGNGDDAIVNSGSLTSNATSTAVMANVSVATTSGAAVAANNAWDGGTSATSRASGIDADSGTIETTTVDIEASAERAQVLYNEFTERAAGNDTVTNSGDIESHALSVTPTISGGVAMTGLAVAVSTSTADSESSGIRGGQGDDTIGNTAVVNATANSIAATINVSLVPGTGVAAAADAVWDGGTSAESNATGIAGDGGDQTHSRRIAVGTDELDISSEGEAASGSDSIINEGNVTASSTATTTSTSIAAALQGVAAATATSTANAAAAAIDAGESDDADTVTNSGTLSADATATAVSASISLTNVGLAVASDSVWEGGTTAHGIARGINVGNGSDTVTNTGDIFTMADAVSGSVNVSGAISGLAVAAAASNARADSSAIKSDDDVDTVVNSGALTSEANSTAVGVAATFTTLGIAVSADSVWDGGVTAVSTSRGIAVGSGDDNVENSGELSIDANADSVATTASIAVTGVAGAISTASVLADAKGIAGEAGNDRIVNEANTTVTADADATAVNVALTGIGIAGSSDAIWDGGTQATAIATGLDGGDGNDVVISTAGNSVDEVVTNTVTADATTSSVAVTLEVVGIGPALAASTATSSASGIDAGVGDDLIENSSDTMVTAGAIANSVSIDVTGAGLAAALTSSTAQALASGLDAGGGNDVVMNNGDIDSRANTDARDVGVAVTLIGSSVAGGSNWDGSIGSVATANGIALGEGDDTALNTADIDATANADVDSNSVSLSLVGFSVGVADVAVEANAFGLDAGDGDDTVQNTGSITAASLSDATGRSIGGGLGGMSLSSAAGSADAHSTAIAGAGGSDALMNSGSIISTATATARARAINAQLGGYTVNDASTNAQATAVGIGGGEGNDLVVNEEGADVTVGSEATTDSANVSVTIVGAAEGDARTVPVAQSTGLTGDAGDDAVLNAGTLSVDAQATSSASGTGASAIGYAAATSGTTAEAIATGIDGGSGDDVLINTGSIEIGMPQGDPVEDYWMADVTTSSFSGVGIGDNVAKTESIATTRSTGIEGGSGNDQISNEGDTVVRATARNVSTNSSFGLLGASSAGAEAGAMTYAIGLNGADGDDSVVNTGSLSVLADTLVESTASSGVFLGDSDNAVVMSGGAEAEGIVTGDGDDVIMNDGSVTVNSKALLISTGGAKSTLQTGNQTTSGSVRTTSHAAGFNAGDGNDQLSIGENASLFVRSAAEAEARNTSSSSASIVSNTEAGAIARTVATATGLQAGEGDNRFDVDGLLTVATRSNAYGFARANGAVISVAGNADGVARANAQAITTGLTAADGSNVVINNGVITVEAKASTARTLTAEFEIQTLNGTDPVTSRGTVEDDLLPDPNDPGLAIAQGEYLFWTQAGEASCSGQNYDCADDPGVETPGAHYELTTISTQQFDEDGDPILDDNGNPVFEDELGWRLALVSTATITEELEEFATTGIGNGKGATGDGLGDARGTATATAVGIELGDGDNLLMNDGRVNVVADAFGSMQGTSSGILNGDATSRAHATANAYATGVILGNGNNLFVNNGIIDVRAVAATSAETTAIAGEGVCISFLFWTWCGGGGSASVDPQENREAVAIGIVTGSGADVVVNNGLISAIEVNGGSETPGIAIHVGAGDDEVLLGADSETIGAIFLGEGDDTLTLSGEPTVNLGPLSPDGISGGDDLLGDTVHLDGGGLFTTSLLDFEHALKSGDGTFTLSGLASLESLTISGGVLELQSDYTFLPTGSYATYFDSNGDSGRLLVNGATAVDGSLTVERRGDTFISDGARYSILDSGSEISNTFADVTLPESRPLLSFDLAQSANSIEVIASAPSFSTVANTGVHTTIADNLYGLGGQASGDFAIDLGTIQIQRDGFDRTFASLSPDSFQAVTTSIVAVDYQASQMLRAHLGSARAVARGWLASEAAYQPVSLAYAGGELRAADGYSAGLQTNASVQSPGADGIAAQTNSRAALDDSASAHTWMSIYGARSDYESDAGYTRIDSDATGVAIGVDYLIGRQVIAGFNINRGSTEIEHRDAFAKTDIDAWSFGVYATWFDDNTFVEGGYSVSQQEIDSTRALLIGEEERTALAQHDGRSSMAFLGIGQEINSGAWRIEPYGTVYYVDLKEDRFAEDGAGSVNQLVEARSQRAMFGELGARFSRLQALAEGAINWHASIALNHDFAIDDGEIRFAWSGAPDSVFLLEDRALRTDSTMLGAGVSLIRKRSTLSLDYRRQTNSDFRNQILSARLSYAF